MGDAALLRIAVFPLPGALLFPRAHLPLHIFEPRYRDMVRDALAGTKLIGMVQPRPVPGGGDTMQNPPLFGTGCLGRIIGCEELEDGCYNIVLEGLSRFRIVEEAQVDTLYRQIEADSSAFSDSEEEEPLGLAQRAELEQEARRYADALGYSVEWDAVARLDDENLVNAIAQVAPFDIGSKQALLEARDIAARCELLVQFMQFQRMVPGGAEGPETMQ